MGKRLSITLTDTQAAALDALAQETGATLQSMIGLAVSTWLAGQTWATQAEDQTPERRDVSGWYGYAECTMPDPLSGETVHEGVGYDGPFADAQQAQEHAERIAAANRADGIDAAPMVEHLDERGRRTA